MSDLGSKSARMARNGSDQRIFKSLLVIFGCPSQNVPHINLNQSHIYPIWCDLSYFRPFVTSGNNYLLTVNRNKPEIGKK